MAAVMNSPRVPKLPNYGTNTPSALSNADRANIAYLFGTPNYNETDTLAAERAVGSGIPGSGFAANNQLRLRDSERINRYQIGHQMLDPYLAREQQVALQSNDNAAALQRIAAQGEEARRQLELQQSGQMQLQSAEAQARLEQIAAQGTEAMEQLRISEAGDTSRLGMSIQGNKDIAGLNNTASLDRLIVGSALENANRGGGGTGGGTRGGFAPNPNVNPKYQGRVYHYQTTPEGEYLSGERPPADYYVNGQSSTPQVGVQAVDRILARYGLA